MVFDRIGSCDHLRPILPRSLHRPLASTDGSRTENLNKTGVRLWTGMLPQSIHNRTWEFRVDLPANNPGP
jgi:hypothetical protein